jgi:hypothetical protein
METKGNGALRWFLILLVVAFVMTLAAVIGVRASLDGRAFMLGLACGAGASVPGSLLALYLARRAQVAPEGNEQEGPSYPPLIIVNGPVPSRPQPVLPDYPPLIQTGAPAQAQPRYRVIGGE